MPENPKLILVKWVDAQADLGWLDEGEAKPDNPPVMSVGWLVKLTKNTIYLAGDIGTDGGNNRRIEIPRRTATEMVELEIQEPKRGRKK